MHQKHKPQGKDRTPPTTAFHWVVLFVLWPNFIWSFVLWPNFIGHFIVLPYLGRLALLLVLLFSTCSHYVVLTTKQVWRAVFCHTSFFFFCVCHHSTRKTLNPKPDLCVLEEYFGLIFRPFCFSRWWEQEHKMVGLETVSHFNVLGIGHSTKKNMKL
jgi:hypothetical protein